MNFKPRLNWKFYYVLGLIGLSVLIYVIHHTIFRDVGHIMIYMIEDLAFLPIYILVVTLGLNEIMTRREKRDMLRKLNMLVGTFYSELGNKLLGFFNYFEPDTKKLNETLLKDFGWSDGEITHIKKELKGFDYEMECKGSDLRELKYFLLSKRTFLLILLENPTLLELESFAELLWGVFNLIDELEKTSDEELEDLQKEQFTHLNQDIKTSYVLLVLEWLDYMRRLKNEHPYFFELASRSSPFERKGIANNC